MTVHSPSPWGQSCHSSAVLDTPSASDQWPQPSTQGLTTSVPLLGSFKGPPKEWQSWSLALFFSLHLPLSNTILGKSFILSKPKSFEYTLLTWMMILELRKLSNLPDVTQLPRGKSGLLESEETFGSYLPVFTLSCPLNILFMGCPGTNEQGCSALRRPAQGVLLPQALPSCPKGWGLRAMDTTHHSPAAPPAPVGKIGFNPLRSWENRETDREVVCLKQHNQLVLESEQSALTFPKCCGRQLWWWWQWQRGDPKS